MKFLKQNYGWVIVTILAILPLIPLSGMLTTFFAEGYHVNLVENEDSRNTLDMLYHISGEFAVRWMTAVLTCTPFYILFGVQNLFVRQAMGIATALWSLFHFAIFIIAEGLLETFTQVNYVLGFVAALILIPLLFTSNRKSMKLLKSNWKKLQSLSYLAIFLSLLHVAILEKTWVIYAVIVGLGFVIRLPLIKRKISSIRHHK